MGATGPQGPAGPQPQYAKLAVVALSGGDYTSPIDAMANLSSGDNWCGNPSALNRCLLKIMPGNYDLGSAGNFLMRSFVDVEGSGQNATRLFATGASSAAGSPATVRLSANAELRNLRVENTGGDVAAIAVASNSSSTAGHVRDVTAVASGGTSINRAVSVQNNSISPVFLENVWAEASGGTSEAAGVRQSCGAIAARNITAIARDSAGSNVGMGGAISCGENYPTTRVIGARAEAWGGTSAIAISAGQGQSTRPEYIGVSAVARDGSSTSVGFLSASSAYIIGSVLEASGPGASYGLSLSSDHVVSLDSSVAIGATNTLVNASSGTMRAGSTRLEGGPVANNSTGAIVCAGVYDEDYVFYANICP